MGLKNSAFTLLELLITLSLMVVIISLGVTGFRHFSQRHFLQAEVTGLQQMIQFARQQAISRSREIVLCGSSDGVDCDGRWSRYGLVKDAHSGQVIRLHHPVANFIIQWRGNFNYHALAFVSSGRTKGQQGSFYVYSSGKPMQLLARLVVNRSGIVRTEWST